MCVIAFIKAGFVLKRDDAAKMFNANRDGAGFAYVDDTLGRVIVHKGYLAFERFWEAYNTASDKFAHSSPFIVHFRVATKGRICDANCHPFLMGHGKAALAHNGSLWGGSRKDPVSDTREFVEDLEASLVNREVFTPEVITELERALGWNKFVILYSNKDYVIIGEKHGSWSSDKRIWTSNTLWVNHSERVVYNNNPYANTCYSHSRMYNDIQD